LHNDSPIENQNSTKQSDPWNEGIVMAVLKHNHTTTTTTPCKKMKALATFASAKCKVLKAKRWEQWQHLQVQSAKLKAMAIVTCRKEKENYDNNVVVENPKP
jgi:hypothetical protein